MRPSVKLLLAGALLALVSGHGVVRAMPATPVPAVTTVDRGALLATLGAARARNPGTFAAVAKLRADLPSLDARKRGPLAVLGPALEGLARRPEGFSALVETLVLDLDAATLTPSARTALRASIAETLGRTRDPRATPILAELLGKDRDPVVVRAAAFGLGRLQTDEALAALLPWVTAASDRQHAVVAGSGACRRTAMARALGEVLATTSDPALARAAIDALGTLGARWAWATADVHARGEELPAREAAARALVGALAVHGLDPDLRLAIGNAVLAVDFADTPALLATAKGTASPSSVAALDALATRFARNPTR